MSTLSQHADAMVLRMAHAIARYIGFGQEETLLSPLRPSVVQEQFSREISRNRSSILSLIPAIETQPGQQSHKWRRHPQLRSYEAPISDDVRNARHEAVRGLCAARAGARVVAINHFAVAAGCDQVDLTAVPGFWNLTRGQMQMVVEAYEIAGRFRDAAALDAHIATIFRPSLVGIRQKPVHPRKQSRKAAIT